MQRREKISNEIASACPVRRGPTCNIHGDPCRMALPEVDDRAIRECTICYAAQIAFRLLRAHNAGRALFRCACEECKGRKVDETT